MFEDSKVVNKYCKLKVRQYNGQKKRQRTNNCNKKKILCNMNPNKHWGELTCSGRESSSCFSHHVTLVKNLVMSHERGREDWIMTMTNGTFSRGHL